MSKGYAVVTGGSRGIGEGLCEQLAKEGYDVLVNYTRSKDRADAVAERLMKEYNIKAASFGASVENYEQVQAMKDFALETFGENLSVLVNNAGISNFKPFLTLTPEEYRNVVNIDYVGTLNCCHIFGPLMIEQNKGDIITIASTAAFRPSPHSDYCGAKGAQLAFNRALAVEWGKFNIKCNVIAPGYIHSDGTAALGPEVENMVKSQSPLNKVGYIKDMQQALSYLLGSEIMTGTTISPNCGVFMF